MQDRIEKSIDIKAPVERVWRALTDYREFGEWFRVKIDKPFAIGELVTGQVLFEGMEDVEWQVRVESMELNQHFSFRGHPHALEPGTDFLAEPTTLVEFYLESTKTGTRLKIVESGFVGLGPQRGPQAYAGNSQGWEIQAKNIAAYVES